ncbi:hypothetical protein [Algibacter sp. R77976]|uniref:hypothetical protein n=1 Tax=Algibacter sp. R77976 TaxID=3093873 RepID=UPI0037CA8DDA
MKNLIYLFAVFISTTAMAQEDVAEVKQETEIKTIKYKNGDGIKEDKVKIITRETSNVKLDGKDKNKINQGRVDATKKVEKMVMIDNDSDDEYDILSKETFYKSGDQNYKFTPHDKGFNMAFDNNNNMFVGVGEAWNSQKPGNYIVKGNSYNGLGFFDNKGDFVVQYYDEATQAIKTIIFEENNLEL